MNMTNDESNRSADVDTGANAPECRPGCDCETSGLSTKGKIIVCLVVGLAAVGVLARGFRKYAEAERGRGQEVFATALPVVGTKSTLWGEPLDSLASLNKVAAEKDGVFVFLSTEDEESTKAATKEIEAAANKITSRGSTVSAYTLNRNSLDYTEVVNLTPAPCVLTMVKGGGGMAVVGDVITEEKLVQAFVTASRPSGCGPSTPGCAPSSSCP